MLSQGPIETDVVVNQETWDMDIGVNEGTWDMDMDIGNMGHGHWC